MLIGALYRLVDGGVAGLIFGWLYRTFVAPCEEEPGLILFLSSMGCAESMRFVTGYWYAACYPLALSCGLCAAT